MKKRSEKEKVDQQSNSKCRHWMPRGQWVASQYGAGASASLSLSSLICKDWRLLLKWLINRISLTLRGTSIQTDWVMPGTQSPTNASLLCQWRRRGAEKTDSETESNKRMWEMARVCRTDRSQIRSICPPLLPSLALPVFPCCLQPQLTYKQWEVSAKHGL